MLRLCSLLLFLLWGAASPALAQNQPSNPQQAADDDEEQVSGSGNGPYWRCVLPGGVFIVPLRAITSLSSHEYVVDGVARVTEVNLATDGSMLVRFYYLEPISPTTPMGIGQTAANIVQEKIEEGVQRSGQEEIWKKVVKNYPVATHAHTAEYRLDNKKDLLDLFNSAERAWMRNRSRQFKRPVDISNKPR